MAREILILDDEPKIADLLRRSLQREGYSVRCVADPLSALDILKEHPIDVLVTDLRMPGMDGLEVLRRTKSIRPACEVVVMTAYATVETAREALKRGAIDYLTKPFSADEDLKPLLRRIFEAEPGSPSSPSIPSASNGAALLSPAATRLDSQGGQAPAQRASQPPSEGAADNPLAKIVTRSPAMKSILDRLGRIAAANASVLLRGESGTGKEGVANAIHALSPRARGPLVKVNCGALPETLLESELFGHVKGAFTGSVADRAGLFEMADGGTIFLDEIGEISPALQVKLLRVLQEGEFQRVGESKTRKVNVRILTATNRDLEAMMRQGSFRQDLYYRLNVVPILLPPLRDRREDIPILIEFFCRRSAPGRQIELAPEARQAFENYAWPGNIRELENAVEHALVLSDPAGPIRLEDLPVALQDFHARQGQAAGPDAVGQATLEDIEQRCLLAALEKTGFNQTRAAQLLGITRRTLGYRIRKYGLEEKIEARRRESGMESGEGQ